MTKKILLTLMICLLAFNLASALQEECNIQVSLVNQDPLPAIPGDYVDVVFQISGIEKNICSGAMFKIDTTYPFSLDEEAQTQVLEGTTWASSNYKTYWTIPYTLRVASDALDGTHKLKVLFGEENLMLSKSFNISIEDSRTNFDAVIQEVSDAEVSIAIANIGKYTANSVVIRIPQQDNFKATETDGQMVGSLDSGDYTIVSFALTQTTKRNMQENNSSSNLLQFDIYYTDALGERRIENMELQLSMTASTATLTDVTATNGNFAGPNNIRKQESFLSSNYVRGAILFIIVIGIFFLYKKYPKRFEKIKEKIISKFHKNKSENSLHEIPEWIKNLEKNSKKKKE